MHATASCLLTKNQPPLYMRASKARNRTTSSASQAFYSGRLTVSHSLFLFLFLSSYLLGEFVVVASIRDLFVVSAMEMIDAELRLGPPGSDVTVVQPARKPAAAKRSSSAVKSEASGTGGHDDDAVPASK